MAVIYVDNKDDLPKRHENDFYETPEAFVHAALNATVKYFHLDFKDDIRVLDPGAGTGVWGRVYRKFNWDADIWGVDIDPRHTPDLEISAYDAWTEGDFLEWFGDFSLFENVSFDLIIGNPPFKQAEEFVRIALHRLTPRGRLVFLLPLDFLGSQKRAKGLFKEHPPSKVIISSRRIQFAGKSPPNNHALYVWDNSKDYECPIIQWMEDF